VVLRCLVAAAVGGLVAYVVVKVAGPYLEVEASIGTVGEKVRIVALAGLSTIAGVAAYIGVAALLRVRELNTLVAIVADLARRRGKS
jgi:hypothetical protein